MGDPFGTVGLRRRVLAAWQASPARFREDANAEEDYALGGYRDRLVVELAQNAADAAGNGPGRLLLSLKGSMLSVSNTGRGLDPAAVEALSSLRASAKRTDEISTVGRYGVGFAAVLAVTDEPAIGCASGGVQWSRARTQQLVAEHPELAIELARRDGHVPVLRLPFAIEQAPEIGYDTTVWLPLRDEPAQVLVRRLLTEIDAGLLLMLPALVEVVIDVQGAQRVLRADDLNVRQVSASGSVPVEVLADRPTEERRFGTWSVRWATPRPSGVPAVVHAPTPTDEPLELPALLIATFPLDPTRRHVASGPLRDLLVEQAALAYVQLVGEVAEPSAVLELIPGPSMRGSLDAELRRAIVERLAVAGFLPGGVRPVDAVVVPGLSIAAYELVAQAVPGLLPPAWARPEIERLGARRMSLGDLVDELASLARPARWWLDLYDALASSDREALAGLPILLADGRVVRGPRGVVVGASAELAAALQSLGLRVADPAVTHPLLERLGAIVAHPQSLLADPAVVAAAAHSMMADDPEPIASAILALVAESGISEAGQGFSQLALLDDEGEWAPAGELLLPSGALADIFVPDSLGYVAESFVTRWGDAVLSAVGALRTFALVRDADVLLDLDLCDHDLDGEDEWLEQLLDELRISEQPPFLAEFTAIRDLDLVAADRWPQALRLIAADPVLRAAVVDPVRVDGALVQSYSAWWLRTHPILDGRLPSECSLPGAPPALTLIRPAAPDLGLDQGFLVALGVVQDLAEAGEAFWSPLLIAGIDPRGSQPDAPGSVERVPDVASRVLVDLPPTYRQHEALTVRGVACEWWIDDDDQIHAETLDGLARGLAWFGDRWADRMVLARVLAQPARADELLAESAWETEL